MSQHKVLHGADAVAAVEALVGRDLSLAERRVVEEEGYVDGEYEDSKGVRTSGVGQTGEWIEKGFEAAFTHHVDRAKERFPAWDSFPEDLQAELIVAEYRGDLGISTKTVRHINAGNWEEAADEFLRHGDYTKSKKGNGAVAERLEKLSAKLREYPSAQYEGARDQWGQKIPEGFVRMGKDEAAFDPNDRGEMKQGFRHELDVMRSTPNPPLYKGDDLDTLVASTNAPVIGTPEVSPEVEAQPAPEETRGAPVQELRRPAPRGVMPSNAEIISSRNPEGPTHSWGDEWAAAFRVDNTAGRVLSKDETDFPIDTEYNAKSFIDANRSRIDALQGADREEIGRDLGSAWSSAHAESRLSQMESDYNDEMLLSEGGGSALFARLGAALLDPVDMAVALSTGGIGGALAKGSRYGKIITSALSSGVAAGTTEGLLSTDNVMRDETDVAFAALAGLTLGGALGSWTTRDLKDFNALAKEVADGNVDAAAARLGIGQDAGAARARPQSTGPDGPLYPDTDDMLDAVEAPEFRFKWLNKTLHNLQGRLFYSESDTVRKIGSLMFEGGFLKDKTKTRAATAEGMATRLDMVFQRNIFAETLGDFKAWSKANGHGAVKREMTTSVGEDFYSQVGKAMRGISDDVSQEAQSAASKIRTQMDTIYQLAQKAGVEGFEEGRMLDSYFPRVLNKNKFTEMRLKYGREALEQFYRDAIIRANRDMDPELATKIGKAYVRTMREKAAGIEDDLLHGIRLDDIDRLKSGWDGVPPKEVQDLIDELEAIKKADIGDRGRVSYSKHRIRFDETHFDDIIDKNGVRGELKFSDLYENDARLVLARYSRAMHGHIAMADKLGVRSRMDFERLAKQAASEAEDAGEDAVKIEQALRDGYDLMMGQPIDRWNPNGDAAQLSRMFSAYNYGGRGGQFGVNALAELGNVVAMGGFRSMLRIFPDMRRVMQRASDGNLEHDLARFAELNFAPGVNTLITPAVRNLDELAEGFGGTSVIQKFAAAMDPYLKSLGRQTSITSGLGPITDATQRIAAIRHLERLAAWANGKRMSKGAVSRLRAAGINAEMQERIFKMLRAADEVTESVEHPLKGKGREAKYVDLDEYETGPVLADVPEVVKVYHITGAPKDVALEPRVPDSIAGPQEEGLYFSFSKEDVRTYSDRATGGKPNIREMEVETKDLMDITDLTNKKGRGEGVGYGQAKTAAIQEAKAKGYKGVIQRGNEFVDPEVAVFDTRAVVSGNGSATRRVNQGGAGKYRKGRLVDIDIDKWTDDEALEALSESSNRVVRDAIQMPDISTSTILFNHPAGRLIFQFMRFPMDAVNKQLMRHAHHMDGESASAAVSSFGIASLVYMAQQSIEYANDPEELKKRLAPEQIAKIGFMRTGYSSLLPGVIDSALWAANVDPQFSMGRSSGLTTIFPIANNPTTTLLKNAATFGGALTRSVSPWGDPRQFSAADMRAGLQTLPYYRTLGLKNVWHAFEQQFPESRKQE